VNPYVETTDGLETMLQMGLKLPGSLPCSQKKKKKRSDIQVLSSIKW
jgi:hypothetical protein